MSVLPKPFITLPCLGLSKPYIALPLHLRPNSALPLQSTSFLSHALLCLSIAQQSCTQRLFASAHHNTAMLSPSVALPSFSLLLPQPIYTLPDHAYARPYYAIAELGTAHAWLCLCHSRPSYTSPLLCLHGASLPTHGTAEVFTPFPPQASSLSNNEAQLEFGALRRCCC